MKTSLATTAAKTALLTTLVAAAGLGATAAQAREFGMVISATPVLEQIAVPRQVCTTVQVQDSYRTGGGALIGALVGGAVGNQFGRGNGRAVSTLVGAVGGGFLGDTIEAQGAYPAYPVARNVQQCRTENTWENRTVAFNVLYEYAGQRYTVQTAQNPGARIALQVAPPTQVVTQPVYYRAPVQTVYYQPINYVRPAVLAPVYETYPRPYYGPNRWEHREHHEHREYREHNWR